LHELWAEAAVLKDTAIAPVISAGPSMRGQRIIFDLLTHFYPTSLASHPMVCGKEAGFPRQNCRFTIRMQRKEARHTSGMSLNIALEQNADFAS
jgi:hypothetical protein